MADYSDEQVEAALDAYHQGGASWRVWVLSFKRVDVEHNTAFARSAGP